jgi:hypothetical protein
MVGTGKRGSDQTQPQEKGKRVKYSKANTVHMQQFIAVYGKAARYPVCQAWLSLRELRAELIDQMKDEVSFEKVLDRAKQLKEEAEGAIKQFFGERKEKEANLWAAQLRKIDKHLSEVQTCYEAKVGLRSFYQEAHQRAAAQFRRESDAVVRTGDVKARRALQRVKKRWNKKTLPGDTDRRTPEILKMLRGKASDQVAAKDGANARYLEAARSGSRPLSDKAWQGLLTAREIQSRLVDAPGDRDAKEVRRLAKKLGIRLAKDQCGRKRKPYLRKKQPKRPVGRPRIKPVLQFKGEDFDQILAELERESRGLPRPRQLSENQFWDSTEARRTAAQKAKLRKRRRQQVDQDRARGPDCYPCL